MTDMVEVVIVEPVAGLRDGLASLLQGADGIRVVAVSADADAALRTVVRLEPTIVLVAAELVGAAQLTRRIMTDRPTPVVVLVSAGRLDDAEPVLAEGAVSAQLRPRDAAGARRFQSVVTALAQVSVVRRRARPDAPTSATHAPSSTSPPPVQMVGVAASTGGPAALQGLFAGLPADLPAPIVVVQHIVAGFMAGLVASLQTGSPLPIRLAEDDERLQPGTVYLAPDDRHLAVTRSGRARLRAEAPVGGYRPSASVLFSSLAAAYGPSALAVVLTGMGTDGLAGLHEVRRAGGRVLAQDQSSSVVYGMPGAAVEAGLTDMTASVEELARRIAKLAQREED